MRIARLHTAGSNAVIFEATGRTLGLGAGALRHTVRAYLLADAERAGGLIAEIEARTGRALLALCADADAVLPTYLTPVPATQTVRATEAEVAWRSRRP